MRPIRKAFLGNGGLALGFDPSLRLREMFWPRIGEANHVQEGHGCGLYIWSGGRVSRVGGDAWNAAGNYGPGMRFNWAISGTDGALRVAVIDCVDPFLPVWVRSVEVSGAGCGPLGLYSSQAYALGGNTTGEAAAWDGKAGRLYHFKGRLWTAISFAPGDIGGPAGVGAGVAKIRDGGARIRAGDGGIEGSPADHGLIESIVGVVWPDGGAAQADYRLAFGRDRAEADANLDASLGAGPVRDRSRRFWERVPASFLVPSLVVASHCDKGGGIVAALDTDILGDYRDHYGYVWPRDAAMCAGAMLRAGMPQYAARYIDFCATSMGDAGFFWQRYKADGSRGSGWHPWDLPGGDLPIQEDETALSLILAGDYLDLTCDLERLSEAYKAFVGSAGAFIASYAREGGRLVRPSFDLWEERRGTFSFTQASCVGALCAAADIASALGRGHDSRSFRKSALLLLQGLIETLSAHHLGFCRAPGDWTADSSLFLIPLLLPARMNADPEWTSLLAEATLRARTTWRRLKSSLAVTLPGVDAPGFARYAGDWYCRPGDAGDLPGNPWPAATAWYVMSGLNLGELTAGDLALYLRWFSEVADEGGHLPEQLDCLTGRPVSVSPLAWSHAMHLELLVLAGNGNTRGGAGEEYPRPERR